MKNFLKTILPKEAAVQQATSSTTEQNAPVVISANDAFSYTESGKIELQLGNALLDANFTRLGRDLMVETEGARSHLVTNYFSQEQIPTLVSDSGKQIRPETVNLLAGDPAANQYAGPVQGAAPIGTIEKLDGDVFVTRGGEEVQLQAGAEVYQNDVIRTDDDGSVGITFIDGSVFSLGNDARMTLDSLVYDAASGEGSSEVTVLKGMFKFISGDIAANNPGDMVVETPVATIGIRGTTGGGNVQGPGMDNQFFLEPNADGTVGWFDVTTDAGTVSMNQPFMQVSMNNVADAPPAPTFTTPEALVQQFQPISNVMPEGRYDARPDGAPQTDPAAQQTQQGDEQAQAEAAAAEGDAPQEGGEQVVESDATQQAAAEAETQAEGEQQAAAEGEMAQSSELLGTDGNEPEAADSEQPTEQMNAAETTAEGTNSDELLAVEGEQQLTQSGNENFDGQQTQNIDPTQNPMDKFVSSGDANDLVKTGKISGEGTQTQNSGTQAAGTTQPAAQGSTVKTQQTAEAQTTAKPASGADSYYQNLQDQVRVGNLPADTLTKPVGTTTGGTTTDGTVTVGTGTTTTPGTDTTTPDTTTPDATTPGTTTGGGAALVLTPSDGATVETLVGDANANQFDVNVFDDYANPNAGNVADILTGGAGRDKLALNEHGASFGNAQFNGSSSGIDAIAFNDSTVNSMSVAIDGAMIGQSDDNSLTLHTGDKTVALNASTGVDNTMKLHVMGTTGDVTLSGGSQAEILLSGTTMGFYDDSTGTIKLTVKSGDNTIGLGNNGHDIRLEDGNNTVTTGTGDDRLAISGGTQYVQSGNGEDSFFVKGGSNHTLDGGNGSNQFNIVGTNGVSATGGINNDSFHIRGSDDANIAGGGGSNSYDIGGASTVAISNTFSNGYNEFFFHNYTGTADITLFSSTAGSDTVHMGGLLSGGQINITLDDTNGTTQNAMLGFDAQKYSQNTYTQSGGDLVIGTSRGGAITLADFFNGKNAYTLGNENQMERADLFSPFSNDDARELNSNYNFTGVKLDGNSIGVTAGSDIVTVSMVSHGLATGDFVTLSGFTAGDVGDNLVIADVNDTWQITVIDANTFVYTMSHTFNGAAPFDTGAAIKIAFEAQMYEELADFNDRDITGVAGQGYLFGNGGNDTLTGNDDAFQTIMHGGDGDDTLNAYTNDIAKGGKGNDVIAKMTENGGVTVFGGDNSDNGIDIVDYSNLATKGVDINLNNVSQGNNTIYGSAGDELNGIDGVIGTAQMDSIYGKDGSAYNYIDGGAGADSLYGGTGAQNVVDYSWVTSAITVSLDASGNANISHAQAGNDIISNFQHVIGGSGDDVISSTGNIDNIFYGEGGADTLTGSDGRDILHGGAGNDVINLFDGIGADSDHDVVAFDASNNGVDTVNDFLAESNPAVGDANAQDALDISAMLQTQSLHNMNYFELLQKGYLQVSQNGANTDIKVDVNGAGAGGLTTIANLTNVTATDLDWKHFITSDQSEYLVNASGSTAAESDDIIVAYGTSVNGYNGNDIIDIRSDSGQSYMGGQGDDTLILGDASIITSATQISGGEGFDTLVMDFATIDLSTFSLASMDGFEAFDLHGNSVTTLQGVDVFNMTDNANTLYIESSEAGASLTLGSGSFTLADATEITRMPNVGDVDMSNYTTYVADYTGSDVYVHVNNNVSASVA